MLYQHLCCNQYDVVILIVLRMNVQLIAVVLYIDVNDLIFFIISFEFMCLIMSLIMSLVKIQPLQFIFNLKF